MVRTPEGNSKDFDVKVDYIKYLFESLVVCDCNGSYHEGVTGRIAMGVIVRRRLDLDG